MFGNKKQTKTKDLKEAEKRIQELEERLGELRDEVEVFKEAMQRAVTNVGIVRYDAFSEVGGEQSFSIALLDQNSNGIVVTSHYGRDTNRVYAKYILSGKAEHALSEEEEEAIRNAKANKEDYGKEKRSNNKKGKPGRK